MTKTIGVIGYGSFGKFLVDQIFTDYKVYLSTTKDVEVANNVELTSIENLSQKSDAIVLCIPLSAYEKVLAQIKDYLSESKTIVDVASVKLAPEDKLNKLLPSHDNFLMTHPLFGPESAKRGNLDGLKFVVTNEIKNNQQWIVDIFKAKGADIVLTTAEDHDKQMAYTHSLTFFISHALANMDIKEILLSAPSYEKLLALKDLDLHHSHDLFETIQKGNPYAQETRQAFLKSLNDIEDSLV